MRFVYIVWCVTGKGEKQRDVLRFIIGESALIGSKIIKYIDFGSLNAMHN